MTDYDIVRDACIKANKAIEIGPRGGLWRRYPKSLVATHISLADVLLAISDRHPKTIFYVCDNGRFHKDQYAEGPSFTGAAWDIRNDDLSQQTPETLQFLADLLRV